MVRLLYFWILAMVPFWDSLWDLSFFLRCLSIQESGTWAWQYLLLIRILETLLDQNSFVEPHIWNDLWCVHEWVRNWICDEMTKVVFILPFWNVKKCLQWVEQFFINMVQWTFQLNTCNNRYLEGYLWTVIWLDGKIWTEVSVLTSDLIWLGGRVETLCRPEILL